MQKLRVPSLMHLGVWGIAHENLELLFPHTLGGNKQPFKNETLERSETNT